MYDSLFETVTEGATRSGGVEPAAELDLALGNIPYPDFVRIEILRRMMRRKWGSEMGL